MREIVLKLDSTDKLLYHSTVIRQGENKASKLKIILNEEFIGYNYTLLFQINEDFPIPSTPILAIDGILEYVITNSITDKVGELRVELSAFTDDGVLIKSAITVLRILKSIDGSVTQEIPEDYVPWYIESFNDAIVESNLIKEDLVELTNITKVALEEIITQGITLKSDIEDFIIDNQIVKQSEFSSHKEDYANLVTEVNKKANKQQEAWITPTLLNGWVAANGTPQYMKDTLGFVRFKGIVRGTTNNTTILTLPVGYRPKEIQEFAIPCGSYSYIGIVKVIPEGIVSINAGSLVWVSMNGFSFRAEQ